MSSTELEEESKQNGEVKGDANEDENEVNEAKIEVSEVGEKVKKEEKTDKEETPPADINGQSQTSLPTLPPKPSPSQEKTASNNEGVHPSNYIAGGFEIIGIKERHGQLRKAVPVMPLPFAVICCVLNLCLPGIGTIVSSTSLFCCAETEYKEISKTRAILLNVVAGFLQLITAIILVGWIWSIIWGVTFVTLSTNKRKTNKDANSKVDV